MSTRGRGRAVGTGRARGGRSATSGGTTRPPNPETLAKIGAPVESQEEVQTGQFDNVEELDGIHEASTASDSTAVPQAAPIEDNESNVETQAVESESSLNPQTPEFSPTSETTKLNPSAPVFSPKPTLSPANSTTSSKLNPTTPEFFPTGINGNYSNTTHSSPLSSTTRSTTYTLNPQSQDFISKSVSPNYTPSSLNVSAPAFVPQDTLPTVMQNGQLDDKQEPEGGGIADEVGFDEEEFLALTPNDIINGFNYPVNTKSDVASESLLKATAEMLIKSTLYPASFDRWKLRLEHTVKAWHPEINSLTNLAEMLIHWGINEPSLRLTSCRICQVLNDMDEEHVKGNFNKQIVLRLQDWFKKRDKTEKDQLVDFSMFFAEMFSRLRLTDQETPIQKLGIAVLALLRQLLDQVHEKSIIGACHIIKLTGPLLDGIQKEGDTSLDDIFKTLEHLSTDQTLPLSSKCVEIIVRVIELRARKWSQAAVPLSTSSPAPTPLSQYLLGPDVIQEEGSGGATSSELSSFQSAFQFQAPVSNPEEWNEFLDEDNDLIEDDDSPTNEGYVLAPECGQEDEMDDEMRKEFEFFVQDLEDHLLNMGEMDPEQFQEEQ